MELIKGTALINKAIASIANRGAKLDASIQLAGLSVLAHIEEHGDVTLADALLKAMPKGARKLALAEWMLAFGRVRVLDKADAQDKVRIEAGASLGYAKAKVTNLAAAEAKPWYECKKEKAVTAAYDVQDEVMKLLKRVQALQAKGDVEIKHADLISKLQEVLQ